MMNDYWFFGSMKLIGGILP